MNSPRDEEHRPLLGRSQLSSQHVHVSQPGAASLRGNDIPSDDTHPSRAIEDDVLPETSTLGRTIGWRSAYIIAISRVIGSGIFATPGTILNSVGSPGLSLLIWVVGAVIAACGLAVALEYGCMLPRSGGIKVYLEFTFRHPRFLASIQFAINAIFLGFTASNCVVFSQYVIFALDLDLSNDFLRKGLSVGLLTVLSTIHAVVPKYGVKLQNFLGWIKVAIIIFMILSGLYVVLFQHSVDTSYRHASSTSTPWDSIWKDSNWNWGVISTAFFKVFYSYTGIDNISSVLNEVKDPVRTLRSVTLTALVTSCALYLLINVAYLLVVPVEEIKHSGELIAGLFFERVFGQRVGKTILPLVVALSIVGNVLVVLFTTARIKQEIARQGILPWSDILSTTKPFNSPIGGLLINYIPSVLVIVLPPSNEAYSFILDIEGYSGQIIGLAVAGGLIWLRYRRPDLRRPFRAPLSAVVVKILLGLALLAAPFFKPNDTREGGMFYATYAIVAISTFAGGFLYWYIWTILLPWWRGYTIEEQTDTLDDGTTITRLVHVYKE